MKKNNSELKVIHSYKEDADKTLEDIIYSDEFINALYYLVNKYT